MFECRLLNIVTIETKKGDVEERFRSKLEGLLVHESITLYSVICMKMCDDG